MPFDIFCLAFKFANQVLGLFDLLDDGILTLVRLLQLHLVLALLSLPLVLHLALDLLPQLIELLFSVLTDDLLSIGILVFDRLLLRVDFLLLPLVLFS